VPLARGGRPARTLILLCAAFALAALAVGTTSRTPAAQTSGETYEACRPGEDAISAPDLPETVRLERCPVGERVIRDNGVGTVLPAPGQGVHVDALTVTGHQELEVTRYRDGTVELEHVGDDTEAVRGEQEVGTAGGPGECSDGARNDLSRAVKGQLLWYFNPRTTPDELSRKGAVRAIRNGTANILNMRNNCGRGNVVPDRVSMTYEGSTRAHAQVGGCENDRKTVVSFGRLPRKTLAVTCTIWSVEPDYDRVHWSDIMINKTNFNWTTRPDARSCKGKYDLASTVTHERGHTFGLGHVSESSHGKLTMSDRSNGPCQSSERSLGLGDWKGLCGKYRDPRDC
jgi:hypothetical protein